MSNRVTEMFVLDTFNRRIAELERQNAELVKAAQDVIERWDSPKWKFLEPTGSFINKLRASVRRHPTTTGAEQWLRQHRKP